MTDDTKRRLDVFLWRLGGVMVLAILTLAMPAMLVIDALVHAGSSIFDNLKAYISFARSVFTERKT